MRGPLTSGGAGGGRGRGRGERRESQWGPAERDVQEGAVPLRVLLRLLLLPTAAGAPRGLPGFRFLGPVNRWGAPAPADAHPDPDRGVPLSTGPTGGLLGGSTAAPDAAGLQADLDLSEPGLADWGGAQQARAAHLDPPKQLQQREQHSLEPAEELALHVSPPLCFLALCPPFQIPLVLTSSLPPSFLSLSPCQC